ncbi:cobalt-precorrin-5B (C(1))-methyltransferase CbiD [Clostridium sp. Marseille-P3244]|uniref:cobalt-precorrin-5B (C(1))-methyltransferase CbiD n=1 Tax=Clostridium sp. Marseille-P3244 TaxID=1871020 RepID=UPI0009307AE8|nr:cobalt-precorrin-5B (C(1))-methyltransferase CbiD [Clostridium sp. Marseille-P3244]
MMEIGRTRFGLRLGYTTGSCAAAAAKASARMLFSGEEIPQVQLTTPAGIRLCLEVEKITRTADFVECGIRKYSGDDPDVTDGLLIFARVERLAEGRVEELCFCEGQVLIDGGAGVGRVTGPGLEQSVGQAAINPVPRRMIGQEVSQICSRYGYQGRVRVTISIPEGEKTALLTFNPRLGIRGGLSVLGTTGIVEPMSEKALTDTIWLEMKMRKEQGHTYCLAVPGNYGMEFLRDVLHIEEKDAVKCSNYIGEAIDDARILGMKGLLLAGHAGKFVKLAAGVMNTHSRQADCRMEVLASHAAMAGAGRETVCRLMDCVSTAEAFGILKEKQMLVPVMKTVTERIGFHLSQRAGQQLQVGAVVFTPEEGILGKTKGSDCLLERIRQEATRISEKG